MALASVALAVGLLPAWFVDILPTINGEHWCSGAIVASDKVPVEMYLVSAGHCFWDPVCGGKIAPKWARVGAGRAVKLSDLLAADLQPAMFCGGDDLVIIPLKAGLRLASATLAGRSEPAKVLHYEGPTSAVEVTADSNCDPLGPTVCHDQYDPTWNAPTAQSPLRCGSTRSVSVDGHCLVPGDSGGPVLDPKDNLVGIIASRSAGRFAYRALLRNLPDRAAFGKWAIDNGGHGFDLKRILALQELTDDITSRLRLIDERLTMWLREANARPR